MILTAHSKYTVLNQEFLVDPEAIRVLMLTDAYPPTPQEHYIFNGPANVAWLNTQRIFADAGIAVANYQELLDRGVFMETCLDFVRPGRLSPWHMKCGAMRIESLLEQFPNLRAIALMGDVAIRCFNQLARPRWSSTRRAYSYEPTVRMEGANLFLGDIRVLPSYLHTVPGFFQDRARHRAVAADMERIARLLR